MKRYPLVDLAAIQDEIGDKLEAAVLEVVRSQRFIGGEKVAEFERAFADYLGAVNAIGVANGTDAIELSLKALGCFRKSLYQCQSTGQMTHCLGIGR